MSSRYAIKKKKKKNWRGNCKWVHEKAYGMEKLDQIKVKTEKLTIPLL